MGALIVIVVSALLICIGAVEESIQPSLSSTADLNSFTGSNNSFTKITSVYPKEVQNTEFIGPSATGAASGATPARIYDFYYPSGVGVGGTKGKKGGDGFCVAVAFNPRLQQPFSLEKFPYTGKPTEFIVPTAHPVVGIISMITFRCWGGGGGSGGTASYGNLSAENITAYASGGGGAFAQATVLVKQGDAISVIVAGGGTSSNGQKGGKGGYGGGGDGGRGYEGSTGGGHGGGGGGGSSSITRSGVLLINAAGGAGAGSSRDCCADGGGAGGALGSSGSVPTLGFSDVSLSSAGKGYVEGDESRRQLYIAQPYSESGSTSAVAAQSGTAGAGGGTKGGTGGSSGSYAISSTGGVANIKSGSSAVFNQAGGYDVQAFPGLSGSGGAGASGLNGGGGGGGGAFGGGGGGSGINGAGGGGGSSYAIQSTSSLTTTSSNANCTIVVDYVNNTCAHVTVTLPLTKTTQGVTKFNLELSNGYVSDEYIKVATILPDEITEGLVNTTGVHVLCGLDPKTPYSIRAVPYVLLGRGFRSNRATFTTLADPFNNYWEPIVPRRVSKGGIGRGFTDSVMNYPNLDVGVEVYTRGTTPANRPAPDNPRSIPRYADPSTTGHPAFPSARKGHSLSTYGDKVYMFGGRSNGYTCAYAYTDILNLGSVQAGREIYPCTNYQPEVQELWTLDVVTYEWELISTANYSTFNNVTIVAYNITPPAREQHTATVAGNYLYIFGGKTDIFISDNATADKLVPLDNYFYNDIWKLELPSHQYFGLNYSMNSEGYGVLNSSGQYIVPIPQNQLLYLTINGSEGNNIKTQGNGFSPREGKCINKIQVKVSIYHPCINQLKIFITGPGDLTGSANYQPSSSDHMVILFDTPETNGTGCSSGLHNFIFDDDSERLTYTCCTSIFSGVYQPNGRINEYLGYSTSADWVLTVQDTVDDLNTGYVVSWGIDFTVSNCVIEYNWINVTSAIMPSPRYHASSLVFGSSIFYFGGRDEYDSPLTDLYRFDTISGIWTELTPMNFGDSLLQASSVGCNLVLTPYGLLRFGGYLRKSSLSMNNEHYVRNVYLLDVVTLRWIELFVSDWDLYDGSLNTAYPPGRYLSAMTFISRKQIQFPNVGTAGSTKTSHYRALFDIRSPSTHTNYVGDIADSVLLYGGFNGAVGSTYDGSGAGLLSDSWMLRLSNFSTNSSTATQQLYLQNSCAWRFSSDTAVPFSSPKSLNTCLGTVNAPCSLREILLLSWCSSNYQAT